MLAEREGLRQSRLKTVLSSLAKRGTAALIPLLRISGRRVLRALIGGFEKPAPIPTRQELCADRVWNALLQRLVAPY